MENQIRWARKIQGTLIEVQKIDQVRSIQVDIAPLLTKNDEVKEPHTFDSMKVVNGEIIFPNTDFKITGEDIDKAVKTGKEKAATPTPAKEKAKIAATNKSVALKKVAKKLVNKKAAAPKKAAKKK